MPLLILPEDPEPTIRDLQRFYKPEWKNLETWASHFLARCGWRHEQRIKNDSLFRVHFASEVENYRAYMQSEVWLGIRVKVLSLTGYKCACCPERAIQVHHRDYRPSVLRGEDNRPLVALCRLCHEAVHGKGKDRRDRSWQDCERVLANLVAAEDARIGVTT